MSYFCHVSWQQLKADLSLQPLPPHAGEIVNRLLAGEEFDAPREPAYEQAVLDRLNDLELVEWRTDYMPWEINSDLGTYVASDWLETIEQRGLLGELFG